MLSYCVMTNAGQIVLLAVSWTNVCKYCVSAHSAIAKMHKVEDDVIEGLREGKPLANARLEALRTFTIEVVASQGRPSPERLEAFLAAGYTPEQALEVVLGGVRLF